MLSSLAFAGVKMGRIPKVEKERALQLQRAGTSSSLTSLPPDQSSTSPGRPLTRRSDGTSDANTSETTLSTDLILVGDNSSGMNGRCEEATTANGTVRETTFSREIVGSMVDGDCLHAGCSNWASDEPMNAANPATKPLHYYGNVEGVTQSTKSSQVVVFFICVHELSLYCATFFCSE